MASRYDAYDMNRGYGIDIENSLIDDKQYILSRKEKEQAKKNEEVLTHYINNSSGNNHDDDDDNKIDDKKRDSSTPTPRRGRFAKRCQADNESRSRSRGRSLTRRGPFSTKNCTDDQSTTTSKKSTASAKSVHSSGAQLHLRSRSRDEMRSYKRSLSRGRSVDGRSVSSKNSKSRRGRRRRGRSKTPSGGERKSTVKFEYMLSMMRRRKNTTPSTAEKDKKEDKSDNNDDGESTNDDINKKASITPFVPENIGSCLLSDMKSITSWNWMFTLNQILSGLSVMLTQVPECISYAYIAGIDPFHALQATWIANIISSVVGGRPGMICGSSGLGALALRFVVKTYGPQYIFYAIILSGLCQVLFGALRLGKYLRLLPPGITIGIVNALACLVLLLQLRYFKVLPGMEEGDNTDTVTPDDESITEDSLNQPWAYFMGFDQPWTTSTSQIVIICLEALVTLIICWILPKYTSIVPATFVAISFVSIVNMGIKEGTDWVAPTVEDYYLGEPSTSRFWTIFHLPYDLPAIANWTTLRAIFPAGLTLFCINLLETMVTINISDKWSESDSEQDRVFYGQGLANAVCGLMGGMSASGLPHTSLNGLSMGGLTSISTLCSGIFMLFAITFAYPAVAMISLGSTMGVALHVMLSMIQYEPLIAVMLKCIPSRFLKPSLLKRRLATPDLFSTLGSSVFALCASTYGLAGYFMGVICYACDPISHAVVILSDQEHAYSSIELNLNKPSISMRGLRRRKNHNSSGEGKDLTENGSKKSKDDNSLVDDSSRESIYQVDTEMGIKTCDVVRGQAKMCDEIICENFELMCKE